MHHMWSMVAGAIPFLFDEAGSHAEAPTSHEAGPQAEAPASHAVEPLAQKSLVLLL
jgi:hypothetical protein